MLARIDSADATLAEVVGALSLAADLGAGQPFEHGLRTCVLATRLAEGSGLSDDERRDVYYVALLRSIGCTSDAHEQSVVFGDELAARAELNLAPHLSPRETLAVLGRRVGAGAPPLRRAGMLAGVLAGGSRFPRQVATAHCEAAERLGARIGVREPVPAALRRLFERWDGKGAPAGLAGEAIPVPARFAQVAYDAALLRSVRGPEAALAAVRDAAGSLYDPAVAALCDGAALECLDTPEPWDDVVELEPGGPTPLSTEALDTALLAAAEFADLKSPWLLGHSTAVAELAEAAAWRLRLADPAAVRRAGLLHDLGRVGVANGVWERPGPLGSADWEAVRLHPYYAERVLSRAPSLAGLAVLAASHHERLDGSGYHRGSRADALPPAARVLAAADAYRAMTEARPYRAALEPEAAAGELRRDVREGRLDADLVAAVLASAGHRGEATRPERPAGLSELEVEVLRLLARGLSNKEIAARLTIAPKTVGHHVAHIYAKAGVSTRAAVALFAMQHRLLDE